MTTSISKHARQEEIALSVEARKAAEVIGGMSRRNALDNYFDVDSPNFVCAAISIQQAIDSATAAKEREFQAYRDQADIALKEADERLGEYITMEKERDALQSRVRELEGREQVAGFLDGEDKAVGTTTH